MKNDPAPQNAFIPDRVVLKEFGISAMSLHRWTNDPKLGFPAPIYISGRKYRSRQQLEEFKARMLRDAIKKRA